MELRILVTTPKGEAQAVEKKLRFFLLGMHKPTNTGAAKDGTSFYWELYVTPKQYANMTRRILTFQKFSTWTADNRIVRRAFKQFGATKEMFDEIKTMLEEGTRVEIVKNATAQEYTEGKTWWQRAKEKMTH